MTNGEWKGYKSIEFLFEGRKSILVFPKESGWGNGHWTCKMEYFEAFPQLQCDMLDCGFHLAYMENRNRWGCDVDHDARTRFADFLEKEFIGSAN